MGVFAAKRDASGLETDVLRNVFASSQYQFKAKESNKVPQKAFSATPYVVKILSATL